MEHGHGKRRAREARRIFITGATDGIGLALARQWHARGERLLLHGRRPLEELDSELFHPGSYCAADLSDASAPARIGAFLEERGHAQLDAVVLNAAAGWVGRIPEQSAESIRSLLEVNLWAPMALTHALLPRLAAARGRLVFISSIAAHLPAPGYAAYATTKAALEGFARSLRAELAGSVEVQLLRPGATRTGIHAKSGLDRSRVDWERFPPAEDVARAIARAVDGPPSWRTIGLANASLAFFGRHLSPVVDGLARRRQR